MFYYDADQFQSPSNEKPLLTEFVNDIEEFLGRLVKHPKSFVKELYGAVDAAWKNASHQFDSLRVDIQNALDQDLERHGLSGPALRLKLNNVSHWYGELLTASGRHPVRKLIEVIDTLLDSVISAVGGSSAIKEIKDAIRDALKRKA